MIGYCRDNQDFNPYKRNERNNPRQRRNGKSNERDVSTNPSDIRAARFPGPTLQHTTQLLQYLTQNTHTRSPTPQSVPT